MCVNFSDTVKICWFFFTCLTKIGETFFNWLAVHFYIFIYLYDPDSFYELYFGIIQALINLAPFLWSLTAYLVQKWRNENSVLTKGEFLWQIPIAFEVRHFMLWKRLKDTIRENQKSRSSESRDAVMMVESQIQTFRMYQTFGTSIPSLILRIVVPIRALSNDFKWSGLTESLRDYVDYFGFLIAAIPAISLPYSCLTSLIMVTETFIYMPIYQKTEMTKRKNIESNKEGSFVYSTLNCSNFLA
jgi:hypothetical protein